MPSNCKLMDQALRHSHAKVARFSVQNRDSWNRRTPRIQAQTLEFSYYVQARQVDLDRGPPQKYHFASTQAHAINLSPTLAGASASGVWHVASVRWRCQCSMSGVSACVNVRVCNVHVQVNVNVQCACVCVKWKQVVSTTTPTTATTTTPKWCQISNNIVQTYFVKHSNTYAY